MKEKGHGSQIILALGKIKLYREMRRTPGSPHRLWKAKQPGQKKEWGRGELGQRRTARIAKDT